jgi:hypothetical protein
MDADPDPVPDLPYHFDADPNPDFLFDADADPDADPCYQNDADPDPQHCWQSQWQVVFMTGKGKDVSLLHVRWMRFIVKLTNF